MNKARENTYLMDAKDIAKVETWLCRMQTNTKRTIDLAGKMSLDEMQESNPMFWALAKLTENVEESIVQLDNLHSQVYETLMEIPVSGLSEQSEQLSWKALKGMRSRLAHQFWNISPCILWRTATEDFPKLNILLTSLRVVRDPHRGSEDIQISISGDDFRALPESEEEEVGPLTLGHHIAFLFFDDDGTPHGVRLGRSKEGDLLFAATPGKGGIRTTIRG